MRELKFRMFNKETGNMIYEEELINISKNYLNNNIDFRCFIFPRDNDEDMVIMQYTGLKDKNGKEIYEGDIVKRIIGGEHRDVGEIVYKDCGFKIYIRDPYFEFYSEITDIYEVKDMGGTIKLKQNFEIIGNIYENPDLLK